MESSLSLSIAPSLVSWRSLTLSFISHPRVEARERKTKKTRGDFVPANIRHQAEPGRQCLTGGLADFPSQSFGFSFSLSLPPPSILLMLEQTRKVTFSSLDETFPLITLFSCQSGSFRDYQGLMATFLYT